MLDKLMPELDRVEDFDQAKSVIEKEFCDFLRPFEGRLELKGSPYVIMLSGVNGVGKTTAAAKLAGYVKNRMNKSVLLAGADTFRAAAVDQLKLWSERIGCSFYSRGMGSDPGAVAYESVDKAIKEGIDVVIIDTGGRLHTQEGLMSEIGKVQKAITKVLRMPPQQTFLVIDATQGQNVFRQSSVFDKFLNITGIIINKLDGTAKGGVLFRVVNELSVPVYFIGTGEKVQDLQEFDAFTFVNRIW
jgi:fused signal recognition particle receptor